MALFSSLFNKKPQTPKPAPDTSLDGERVILRMGDPADWHDWRQMRDMSRDFLIPWEPTWPKKALEYSTFCGLLRRGWREWREGTAYAFMVLLRNETGGAGPVIGGINLNDIQRGISQKGTLGYWMGEPYAGQGLMTEAARLVCDFAFDTLKLNRVEASCLPNNTPSKALLRRLGFTEEGFARAYLKINGKWEDHVLWGRVNNRSPNKPRIA